MHRAISGLLVLVVASSFARASTHAPPARQKVKEEPRVAVARMACGTARRSLVSETSLHLVYVNHTRGAVTIYWLDFNGERVWYNTLEPGESYSQQTYVTHPWVVVDADGNCLEQLVPTRAGTFLVPIDKD